MKVDYDSKKVALAMALRLAEYAKRLEEKRKQSGAEKRHLLRIRTVKAIRDANWEVNR
jgi:hypothetical protein